jgi:hypothetical protein
LKVSACALKADSATIDAAATDPSLLNNHQLKLVGLIYGLEVRIRVA